MELFLIGSTIMVLGVMLYYKGYTINNDIGAQMESIFDDGKSNPGDNYIYIGILIIIIAIIIIIAGMKTKKREEERSINESEEIANVPIAKETVTTCPKCGATVTSGGKFCMECGEPLSNGSTFVFCPHCGESLPNESKYCMNCGKEIPQK